MGVNTRNMYSCLQKCNKLHKSHIVGQLLNSHYVIARSVENNAYAIALNGGMIHEWWFVNFLLAKVRGICIKTIKQTTSNSVNTAAVQYEIWTRRLPSYSQAYTYSSAAHDAGWTSCEAPAMTMTTATSSTLPTVTGLPETCVGLLFSVASGVPGGVWVVQPPRNSEGPPKSCQTQPNCENC